MKVYFLEKTKDGDYERAYDQKWAFSSLELAKAAAEADSWEGQLEWEESRWWVGAHERYKNGYTYSIETLEMDQVKGA